MVEVIDIYPPLLDTYEKKKKALVSNEIKPGDMVAMSIGGNRWITYMEPARGVAGNTTGRYRSVIMIYDETSK